MEELLAAISNPELARKLRALFEGRRPSALSDHVQLNIKGRIKLEMYDREGNILKVVDQDNLVTKYAWEIITRLIASDPAKHGYEVPELLLDGSPAPRVETSGEPEVRWLYSATPQTIYRHEYQTRNYSYNPWRTNRVWYDYNSNPSVNETSLVRDVVSVYLAPRPLGGLEYMIGYIGIGDGEDYLVPLTDEAAYSFSGTWDIRSDSSATGGMVARTTQPGASVTITFHGTRLVGFFTYTEDGADVEVKVDGVPTATLSLYSAITAYGRQHVLADGLSDGQHTVELTHKGTGFQVGLGTYTLSLEAVRANGLTPSLNSLFREIPRTTTKVSVPELYNTSSSPPYTFTLTRGSLGIVPGSETVVLNGEVLVRTPTAPTQPNEYSIDYVTGTIQLARPAMGVQVTYETAKPFSTNYQRAAISRPSPGSPNYPWYDLERSVIYFTADFPPGVPNYPVKVREIGLFDFSDNISIAKMFSIVRPGETVKDVDTGLRITWEIRLRG